MRDAHRIRERYEVSLDNRQIVSVVISALVVLGAVFVLGVVVGKKLSSDQHAADAPDILSALDAKAAAMEQAKKDPAPLTFQEELTKKSTEPLPPPTTVGLADAGGSLVAVAPKPAPALQPTSAPVGEPNAIQSPEGQPKPEEMVAARTTDAGGALQRAIARAQIPAEAAEGGAFTLQLSASQDRAEAERYIAKLRDRGYAPYMVSAEVPGRGTWYRVRMGSFPSKEAADRYLQDFRRETQLEAFVAPNN